MYFLLFKSSESRHRSVYCLFKQLQSAQAFSCMVNILSLDFHLSGYVHLQSPSVCKTSEKGYCKAHVFLYGGKNLEELAECSSILLILVINSRYNAERTWCSCHIVELNQDASPGQKLLPMNVLISFCLFCSQQFLFDKAYEPKKQSIGVCMM